jgi:hypothetical protein
MYPQLCANERLDDGTGVRGDTGPEVGALLGDAVFVSLTALSGNPKKEKFYSRAVDGGTLHLTLGVDDDTGVVLEVEEDTVPTAPGLALTADDGGHDLLAELGLTLLNRSHDHVTGGGGGETVKTGTEANDGNDVEVCGSVS